MEGGPQENDTQESRFTHDDDSENEWILGTRLSRRHEISRFRVPFRAFPSLNARIFSLLGHIDQSISLDAIASDANLYCVPNANAN